jgi:hypothetical protein
MADVQRFEVRSRTGSHAGRGALIGLLAWGSVMTVARVASIDEAGWTSWQSAAIFAGAVGGGTLIGSRVPRYGWWVTEPRALSALPPAFPPDLVRLTLRF